MLTMLKFSTGSLISSLMAEIITANLSTSSWLSSLTTTFAAVFALAFTLLAVGFCSGISSLTRRFITFDYTIINNANDIKATNTIENPIKKVIILSQKVIVLDVHIAIPLFLF